MVWHENRESAALSASAQPSPPAAVAVIVRAHARDFRLLRVAIPPVVLSRIMRDTRSFFVLFFCLSLLPGLDANEIAVALCPDGTLMR